MQAVGLKLFETIWNDLKRFKRGRFAVLSLKGYLQIESRVEWQLTKAKQQSRGKK